jgi:GNAT superfamily N-acetyltransferase
MPITYRRATLEDADGIVDLFIEARTRCLSFLEWEYDRELMERVYAEHWFPNMEFQVAELDGEIVGFAAFQPGELDHLYVHPDQHDKGIGTHLLNLAIASSEGDLRLWVFQGNRQARAFYERRGFELEFETDGQHNMEKHPDARYVRKREWMEEIGKVGN